MIMGNVYLNVSLLLIKDHALKMEAREDAGASSHFISIGRGSRRVHVDQQFNTDSHPAGVYSVKCQ